MTEGMTERELDKMLYNEKDVLDALEAVPKDRVEQGDFEKSGLSDRLEVLRGKGYFSGKTHDIADKIRGEADLPPRHLDDSEETL